MLSRLHLLAANRSVHKHLFIITGLSAFALGSVVLMLFVFGSASRASAAPAVFDCATVSEIPQSECNALVTFFASTNGSSWTTKTNWLETNTPCSWYGITCASGRITRIILNNNQLSGTIPPQLEQLSQLDWLDLSNNQLADAIPAELAQLTNLHVLRLQNNQLTGFIPSQLGDLTGLGQLYLGINPLTGSIPVELGKLVNLTILYLPSAQLTGSIPPELGNMVKLSRLELRGNHLSGPIPTALGRLSGLVQLLLSDNQLSGEIPPDLGNLKSLTVLYLDSNTLSGPIPTQLGALTSLDNIQLHNNQLSGSIPRELSNLANLRLLYLHGNKLSGSIPAELGNLANLQQLYLQDNKLTGSIPADFGNLAKMSILLLGNNFLTGSIPPELGNMTDTVGIDLQNNLLTGSIPASLGQLTKLRGLLLNRNQLSGLIPKDLGKLTALDKLWLHDNQLSGSIPPDLGNLASLHQFYLLNNQLSGEIPPELGNLVNANIFLLYNNALTGEVPRNLVNVGKDWIATQGGTIGIDLDYNVLSASDPLVKEFLTVNNSTFFARQTLPPTNLQVSNIQTTSVGLSWSPPDYAADPGGYEVRINQHAGSSEILEIANDKRVVTGTVSNLCPGTTYSLALRTHTAPHGDQKNHLRSEFTTTVNAITLPRTSGLLALYILALDSDLDTQYDALLQAIQSTTKEDFGKVAVVLVDRKGENNTHILHIECGVSEVIQGLPNPTTGQLDPTLREYNMADPAALGAFIKWARQTYDFSTEGYPPTILSYVGHGVAIAPDTDVSKYVKESATETIDAASLNENSNFARPTQTKINMTPDQLTDATSKSLISPYVLAQALKIGTDNGAQPLILLDIIHCFGGTIEEFYELANPGGNPFAQVMTGSPNYAYAGADMLQQALLDIQPTQDAREMAAKVVQAYDTALNQADQSDNNPDVNHPRIIVAVESSKIPTITLLIDQLVTGLLQEFDRDPANTMDKIKAAQRESVKFDTTTCKLEDRPQDFKLDSEDGLADLADFVTQLKAQFLSVPAVLAVADQIIVQVNVAVITTNRKNGYPWFATDPKPFWEFPDRAMGIGLFTDFNGITLQGKPYVTWQAYWYNRAVSNENPHPYAFVKGGDKNWSDLFARFWEEQVGQSGEVGTYACSTTLPEVRFIKNWLYLPLIVR